MRTKTLHYILLLIAPIMLFNGCRNDSNPNILSAISTYVSADPHKALLVLDSIDYHSLSIADRHYYDFLTIKANDKSCVRHTSDSLILDVIAYYSSTNAHALYAEALYYGGRVYSDLGDYPSALNYFHQALQNLPNTDDCLALKARILSQAGRLLNILRLYDKSETYLKQALETERLLNDTVAEINDLHLLGNSVMNTGRYTEAEDYFTQAIVKSRRMPTAIRAKSSMNLAALKYETGQIESALSMIRGMPDSVAPINRNTALAYAAKIYRKAAKPDSAFMYARELIESKDPHNQLSGYYVLLSPELRHLSDTASIFHYLSQYVAALENTMDDNSNQLAILQQSRYNYNQHVANKEKLAKRNHTLMIGICLLIIAVLMLCMIYLYKSNRYRRRIIELQNAINNIGDVKKDPIFNGESLAPGRSSGSHEDNSITELKAKLMEIVNNPDIEPKVPDEIIQSEAYQKILDYLRNNKPIVDNDNLWNEIESLVYKSSPKFRLHFIQLFGNKLDEWEMRTILLIKCGFAPTQVAVLAGRSKSGVSTRRKKLRLMILDGKVSPKDFDRMIRAL